MRAVVLREPGDVRVEEVDARAAARRARCSCASRPAASATPTSTSPTGSLGEGRWPMVLGHEGAGTVEAVGEGVVHVAPGDRVVLLHDPVLRRVQRLPRGPARRSAVRRATPACAAR